MYVQYEELGDELAYLQHTPLVRHWRVLRWSRSHFLQRERDPRAIFLVRLDSSAHILPY